MKSPLLRMEDVSPERYAVSDLQIENVSEKCLWLFDLEATGLDTTVEQVTQIAGIPLHRGEMLEDRAFSQLVKPGVPIPEEIQELTGITPARVADAPGFPEAWRLGVEAAQGCDLWLGQSVFEFDVPLLDAELARHGLPPELPPILDSVVIATMLLGPPEGRWSTTALVERFDVDTSGLRRHDALDDVKILGRTLLPMLELLRAEHDDRLVLAANARLQIARHPPIVPA
jgi:DNA polymerase III epsilon subunit-like protein